MEDFDKRLKKLLTEDWAKETCETLGLTGTLNLTRDWPFKYVFGKERNMILLLDRLLPGKKIRSVRFDRTEHEADREKGKGVRFDLACTGDDGTSFTVEMQVRSGDNIRDRLLYYATFPVAAQMKKGEDYNMSEVYVICILCEELKGVGGEGEPIRLFSMRDCGNGAELNPKLHLMTVELSRMDLKLDNIRSAQDALMYFIIHSREIAELPEELKNYGLENIMEDTRFANMRPSELLAYVVAEDNERILKERCLAEGMEKGLQEGIQQGMIAGRAEGRAEGMIAGRAEGKAEGREEGMIAGKAEGRMTKAMDIARNLLKMGMPMPQVLEVTGLTEADLAGGGGTEKA